MVSYGRVGSPIFLPPGLFIYHQLMKYLRKQYKLLGYSEVQTPDMWKNWLWKTSGHFDKYKENMFSIEDNDNNNTSDNKIKANERHSRIATRAYQIFQKNILLKSKEHNPRSDWFEAEEEIRDAEENVHKTNELSWTLQNI